MPDTPKDEPKSPVCPKCGGNWLACSTGPGSANSGYFRLYPIDAGFFSLTRSSAAKALVCDSCGYTELYALNPKALKPKR